MTQRFDAVLLREAGKFEHLYAEALIFFLSFSFFLNRLLYSVPEALSSAVSRFVSRLDSIAKKICTFRAHLRAGRENGQRENGAAEETNGRASLYATPTRFVCPRKLCFSRDDVGRVGSLGGD